MRKTTPLFTLSLILTIMLTACNQGGVAPPAEEPPQLVQEPEPAGPEEQPAGEASPAGPAARSNEASAGQAARADSEMNRRNTVFFDAFDGRVSDPENWNPLAPGRRLDHGFHQAVIEPLFILNYETGRLEPWLAESMTANETLEVWTLALRRGVKWSDGQTFDADDVLFTVDLLLAHAPELASSTKLETWVESAEKVDDLTIRFELKKPNPRFQLDVWSVKVWGGITIVPEHIWRGRDPLTFKNYDPARGWPVFTGPYKLVSAGQNEFVYNRDEAWWGAQTGWRPAPQPEWLVWQAYDDRAGAAAMAARRLDSLGSISFGPLMALRRQNPNVITYFEGPPYAWVPDPCSRTFEPNHTAAPWGDKDMRWALNYAIDRDEIVAFAVDDTTLPSRHFFPVYSALNRYVDLLEEAGLYEQYPILEHDPDRARAIIEAKGYTLNEAGFYEKEGRELALPFTTTAGDEFVRISEVIAAQLQQVGIKAEVEVYQDYTVWRDELLTGAFDAHLGAWTCGSVNEPWASLDTFNTRWLKPAGQAAGERQNIWRWSGPAAAEYSALVDQIGSLPLGDPKIDALFVEAMTLWLEELPVIPITQASLIAPFDTTYWQGWPTGEDNYIHPPTWWQSAHVIIHNLEPVPPQ